MTDSGQQDFTPPTGELSPDAPREGAYDEQLSFAAPLMGAPRVLETIIKRDGREVPFDKGKIADAILRAAESIGGADRDRAESLASGVAIYLGKMLNGRAPTVEQVQDAVEKVLVEMGHTRTALAFARYRDKRARIRRLRQGDMRPWLDEFEEARREQRGAAAAEGLSLFVRTSEETLVRWDREKIVAALTRETRLERRVAELIAAEVEQQILSAEVRALTASLIRELVDAKLVEHGLEEHRRRHMRLGVPLYDAERIICVPGETEPQGAQDPAATDLVLAERVKKEFALSQVFSCAVGDAHLAGHLYLSRLGFVDRLHSATLSLDYVTRAGTPIPGIPGSARPPSHLDVLLVQAGRFRAMAQAHFSGPVTWDAPHVYLAPFLDGADAESLHRAAHILLLQLGSDTGRGPRRGALSRLALAGEMPEELRRVRALGPGGAPTAGVYGDYAPTARAMASAILELYQEGRATGATHLPALSIRVSEAMFTQRQHRAFLARAAALAVVPGGLQVEFERPGGAEGPASRRTVAHQVTLNLPRAAYETGSEGGLLRRLDEQLALAVGAHEEKRDFLDRLIAFRGLGPLSLLAGERAGGGLIDFAAAEYLVAVDGLNECVQALTGAELHASAVAAAMGERVLAHVADACRRASEQSGLNIVAAHPVDETESRRFAALDLQPFPEQARRVIKSDPMTQDLHYTPGAQLNRAADLTPLERTRLEGRFHAIVPRGAVTHVRLPEAEMSSDSLGDFLQTVFYRTESRCVRIER